MATSRISTATRVTSITARERVNTYGIMRTAETKRDHNHNSAVEKAVNVVAEHQIKSNSRNLNQITPKKTSVLLLSHAVPGRSHPATAPILNFIYRVMLNPAS